MNAPRFVIALLVLTAAWLGPLAPARAEEAPRDVPAAEGLQLDGRLDEAAWADALVVPAGAVDVPDITSPTGVRPLGLDVRLLRDATGVWIGVRADESPGGGVGLHVFVAGPDALTAADAWGFTYRPLELRADRLAVLAPFVDARAHFPVDAAVDISQAGSWTIEAYVPFAPVHTDAVAPRRLGLGILTRTANVFADAPAGAFARGPAQWLPIAAPADGWEAPVADEIAYEAETQRESRRRAAFAGWMRAMFEAEAADARPEYRALSRLAARAWEGRPLDQLLEARQRWHFPPFGFQALIRADARDADTALESLQQFYEQLAAAAIPGTRLLGPAPAPLEKRAGRFRAQLLIQCQTRTQRHQCLLLLAGGGKKRQNKKDLRWSIDVDPVELS